MARITPEIETLAADMLATMYDAPGVGPAAPQGGVLSRLYVMDCEKDPEAPPGPGSYKHLRAPETLLDLLCRLLLAKKKKYNNKQHICTDTTSKNKHLKDTHYRD